MALPDKLKGKYRLVNYQHIAFEWRGRAYNVTSLTVEQAEELLRTGWPYIAKVKKQKPQHFPDDF